MPVTAKSGEILIPQQIIQNCKISETLKVDVNNWANAEICNNSETDVNFTLFITS